MPSWGRYAVTVYVGLLMSGTLGRAPMAARSASQHDGGAWPAAKLAPYKAPKADPAAVPDEPPREPNRETAPHTPRPG
jgi:hypothetical protein